MQVLVLSYPTYRMHKAAVCAKKPDLLICDEAHFLKNSASQTTEVSAHAALRMGHDAPRLLAYVGEGGQLVGRACCSCLMRVAVMP